MYNPTQPYEHLLKYWNFSIERLILCAAARESSAQ